MNKKISYAEIFQRWFNLVGFQDPQYYQDRDWDWSEEIQDLLDNPAKALNKAAEDNPDTCPCCGDPFEDKGGKWHRTLHGNVREH